MERKICLTGASGFIGRNLEERLKRENIVPFNWNRQSPNEFGDDCECLAHLAGRAHRMKEDAEDPLVEFRKVNRDLTLSLAENALRKKVEKFIFISSVKAAEEFDPYGQSKREAEQGLEELFRKQTKARCIILRLPMVYGPGNKGNMLPLLKAARRGIPLPLGSVRSKRSMLYVGNFCDAVLKILKDDAPNRPAVRTYFLSDDCDLTSGELYDLIFKKMNRTRGVFPFPEFLLRGSGNLGSLLEKALKRDLPLNREIISRLCDEYRFSSAPFMTDYDWKPPFKPEEGVGETVDWFRQSCGR